MGLGVLRLGRHWVATLNKEAFKQPPGGGASVQRPWGGSVPDVFKEEGGQYYHTRMENGKRGRE